MPAQRLIDVAHAHLVAEGACDFDATLATFEGEPVYELLPVGRRMRGMAAISRYYRHFFAEVVPRFVTDRIVVNGSWLGETGFVIESNIVYRHDDDREEPFSILGILKFGERALVGERIYADETFLRIMFAGVWNEMEPMDG